MSHAGPLNLNSAQFLNNVPLCVLCVQVVSCLGLADEASCALGSLETTLRGGSAPPSDAERIHVRIGELQAMLTHTDVA